MTQDTRIALFLFGELIPVLRANAPGGKRVNFSAFYKALLEAKGAVLSTGGSAGIGKGGRTLT